MTHELIHGDCRDVLASMADASIDAIVTDPPYELGFMGKQWDASGIAYNVDLWREALRVLKPGGHLLAFGGTRTYHRMAAAIEDAGFEIRDSIHWLYGSGFPKSLDVSKAIDKAAGAEREVVGEKAVSRTFDNTDLVGGKVVSGHVDITAPATDAAKQWAGWGTALKPAHEPIVVARKPLGGTVAACVLEHGTGALNIDGCRVAAETKTKWPAAGYERKDTEAGYFSGSKTFNTTGADRHPDSRWPANIVLTHAADCDDLCAPGCPVAELDEQSGELPSGVVVRRNGGDPERQGYNKGWGVDPRPDMTYGDSGGASRFFTVADWHAELDAPFRYVAKPSRAERNAGLDSNYHPTVKPVALMRWLVRLVTPPGGTVLDPFAGSGTTLVAAVIEGFHAVGIELTDDYLPIIHGRVSAAQPYKGLPLARPRTQADGQLDLFGGDAA